ncbi:hypothetical protein FAZ15_21330 [Sphingobacterium olei]|uniref:Lipoprotein n=1 Tax=Sphingobacterium olei TaxID=2571155 RepID=A0A4U0N9Z7_9SPHI|nr:hypothetical protein FAZ15_21330 [Sphingobacterium olei]
MDNTLKCILFFCIVLFSGCDTNKGPSLSDRFNVQIELSPWLTFDYHSRVLKLEFRKDDILIDTIRFTQEEDVGIKKSFEKNCIALIEGEYRIGTPRMYPSDAILMKIYRDTRVISMFHCVPDYKGVNDIEKRIASFNKVLVDIITEKEEYKKMVQESMDRQEKYHQYLF